MKLDIGTLSDEWEFASLLEDFKWEPEFGYYLAKKVEWEVESLIERIRTLERATGVANVIVIDGQQYRLTMILAFIGTSFVVKEQEMYLSDNEYLNTKRTADQLARIIEYGNEVNTPLCLISKVLGSIKKKLKAYWAEYTEAKDDELTDREV